MKYFTLWAQHFDFQILSYFRQSLCEAFMACHAKTKTMIKDTIGKK